MLEDYFRWQNPPNLDTLLRLAARNVRMIDAGRADELKGGPADDCEEALAYKPWVSLCELLTMSVGVDTTLTFVETGAILTLVEADAILTLVLTYVLSTVLAVNASDSERSWRSGLENPSLAVRMLCVHTGTE